MTIRRALTDGIRRVSNAPIILLCVYFVTLVITIPFSLIMRDAIARHLGNSMASEQAARGFNYQWLIEYQMQAGEVGKTLGTKVIGFAAVLDNLSALADNDSRPASIVWLGAAYLTLWLFLSGGILDRYARNRPTRTLEFFAACGVYFARFLRLAPFMVVTYYVLFAVVHPMMFNGLYGSLARDLTSERTAFLYRMGLYGVFGTLVIGCNTVFDYAKVRAVVEDRRSAIGAILAGLRFIRRNFSTVVGLYAANALLFVLVLVLYAVVAPGVAGGVMGIWMGFAIGQLYVAARLWVRLVSFASETSLFQGRLAHAGYVAGKEFTVAEPPIVEQVVG